MASTATAKTSQPPETKRYTEPPNNGVVVYSNQKYLIDDWGKIWPYSRMQAQRPHMSLFNPWKQEPFQRKEKTLRDMTKHEILTYVHENHPDLLDSGDVEEGMTTGDIKQVILRTERQERRSARTTKSYEDFFDDKD